VILLLWVSLVKAQAGDARRRKSRSRGMVMVQRSLWMMMVVVAVAIATFGDGIPPFLRAAYPTDPFKRDALAKCQAVDVSFVRFSSGDRAACYSLMHIAPLSLRNSEDALE
jgi:hypothetical protein